MAEGLSGDEILITPQRVCCPPHGEHFRARWPQGWALFSIKLFQAAAAGGSEPGSLWAAASEFSAEPGPREINLVTERRPFCYFVSRDELGRLLRDSEIGLLGRCQVCGRSGLGGEYTMRYPMGDVLRWLCFECALDGGEREHQLHPDGGVWTDSAPADS